MPTFFQSCQKDQSTTTKNLALC